MNSSKQNLYIEALTDCALEIEDILPFLAENHRNNSYGVFQKRDLQIQKRKLNIQKPIYSIIALEPAITVSIKEDRASVVTESGEQEESILTQSAFDFLRDVQRKYCVNLPTEPFPHCEFATGLIGYFGFGLVHTLESIKRQTADRLNVPDCIAFIPKHVICIDHETNVVYLTTRGADAERTTELKELIRTIAGTHNVKATNVHAEARLDTERLEPAGLEPMMAKAEFLDKVNAAKAFIEEGQCFQIVVSQRFTGRAQADAITMFETLLATAPSTYNYLLNFNAQSFDNAQGFNNAQSFDSATSFGNAPRFANFQYLGASPETMVNVKNNRVELCALAGTRPRGSSSAEDEQNENELKADEKELAEHRMLVDLGRNDLGKICAAGSIQVGPVAQVLKYSNVMHLGTAISGTLEESHDSFDALKACFPRGTVSGAPKVRALELLADLEPEQRGIYSGAIGFFDERGSMDTAIAIRSALVKDGVVHVNAGAGIVFDSNPESEYQETINKASAIAKVIARANALSTVARRSTEPRSKTAAPVENAKSLTDTSVSHSELAASGAR